MVVLLKTNVFDKDQVLCVKTFVTPVRDDVTVGLWWDVLEHRMEEAPQTSVDNILQTFSNIYQGSIDNECHVDSEEESGTLDFDTMRTYAATMPQNYPVSKKEKVSKNYESIDWTCYSRL